MKQIFLSIALILSANGLVKGQDTFSIVAVDSVTGEVGSAGASCLDGNDIAGGAVIISDLIPGKGAIHTQSFWRAGNQTNARNRMLMGESPDQIMTWLGNRFNDVDLNSSQRQYGAAAFMGTNFSDPQAASFTGANCFDWKGHRVGTYYAIQGNILLGPQIIDSMEAHFLRATGTLADRLMEALQGANVPGADSRCLAEGVSSQSAFLRVAKPDNRRDSIYLDINIDITPFGKEPIDSLQDRYDDWKRTVGLEKDILTEKVEVFPQPAQDEVVFYLEKAPAGSEYELTIFDAVGKQLFSQKLQSRRTNINLRSVTGGSAGILIWTISRKGVNVARGKLVKG